MHLTKYGNFGWCFGIAIFLWIVLNIRFRVARAFSASPTSTIQRQRSQHLDPRLFLSSTDVEAVPPGSSNSAHPSAKVGLYVHIPYCRRRCRYCNFAIVPIGSKVQTEAEQADNGHENTIATQGFLDMDQSYRDSVLQEISLLKQQQQQQGAPGNPVLLQSIYFGGGTPSLAPLETIRAILEALFQCVDHNTNPPVFSLIENPEITIEMDPGTFSLQKLQALKDMGFNRISLGVQSFDDNILASIGRVHRRKDIFETLTMLETVYGKDDVNYSIDLISGLPGLSLAHWTETLATAVSLEPKPRHISLYDLQIEQGTVFGKWFNREGTEEEDSRTTSPSKDTRGSPPVSAGAGMLPSEEECAFMYKYAAGYLRAKGYEHYEVSSYAYVGDSNTDKASRGMTEKSNRSRHNQIYWDTDGQWYALGLGATSFVNGKLTARPSRMVDYQQWVRDQTVDTATSSKGEFMEPGDFLTDVVMKRLRTADGLDLGWVRNHYGEDCLQAVLKGAELGLELDLMTLVNGTDNAEMLRLNDPDGFLYSNNLISGIFMELGEFQD